MADTDQQVQSAIGDELVMCLDVLLEAQEFYCAWNDRERRTRALVKLVRNIIFLMMLSYVVFWVLKDIYGMFG